MDAIVLDWDGRLVEAQSIAVGVRTASRAAVPPGITRSAAVGAVGHPVSR